MLRSDLNIILLTTRPLKYLDTHELDILMTYCQVTSFSNGQILCKQGKKSDGMYIIIEGEAIITVRVLGKDILNLTTLSDGNFFGEVSLIKKVPSTATVIASGEVKCLQLTTAYFDMLAIFFPNIRYKIIKAITEEICGRLRDLHSVITKILHQAKMAKQPVLSGLLKSFTNLETTTFENSHINIQDLKLLPFFNSYSNDEFNTLLNYSELIKTDTNCTLIHEKENNTPYFVIICGAVQSSIESNNKIAKLSILSPMNICGNISFIDAKPSIITYTTCEKTILLKFTENNLILLEKHNRELWYKLFNSICDSFVSLEIAADKLVIRLNCEIYNR